VTATAAAPLTPPPLPVVPLPAAVNLPPELRASAAFILWFGQWKWNQKKQKWELSKVPCDRGGVTADMTDPAIRGGLADALIDASKLRTRRGTHYGIGLSFCAANGVFFNLDLDGEFASDDTTERYRWLESRSRTWTELSISRRGGHRFYRESFEGKRVGLWRGRKLEIFGSAGFIALTGEAYEDAPVVLADGTDILATILTEMDAEKAAADHEKAKANQSKRSRPPYQGDGKAVGEDIEIIARMRSSRNAGKIQDLWDGGGPDDTSVGDLALANYIAFWVGAPDEGAIDRIFRVSRRLRPKWDEVHSRESLTYGQMTIKKALAGRTDFYRPGPKIKPPAGTRAMTSRDYRTPGTAEETGVADEPATPPAGGYTDDPIDDSERGDLPGDQEPQHEQPPPEPPTEEGEGDDPGQDADDNPLISGALDNTAFHAAEFRREWVIEDVLVCDEPGALAGPSKAMKTGLIVEGAVSVAAGRKFLNRYWAPKPRKVYVISAESGPVTLQARMREVCKAKGVDPVGLPIQWYTEVENLATLEGCRNLADAIHHFGSELVLLDPGYLLLASDSATDNAGNMYAMGGLLRPIGDACRKVGATLVIATHTNGKLQTGTPPELPHISYSGYQQWCRQWLLLNRRTDYEDDGRHELLLRFGGSAGHSGLVNLSIDEGILKQDGSGRKWEVSAVDASAARKQEKRAKADAEVEKLQRDSAEVLKAMLAIPAAGNTVATTRALEDRTGLKRREVLAAVKLLIAEGGVVEAEGEIKCGHGRKAATGIRRPDRWA
jgi:hypothetical protein